MSRKKRQKIIQVAAYVYAELRDFGAEIESAAATTNTVYMSFKSSYFGKLRISDHKQRSDVRYTWNIILDGEDEIVGNLNYSNYKSHKAFVEYMKLKFTQHKSLRQVFGNGTT